MEMYLVLGHDIKDIYYYLLTKEQWEQYNTLETEDAIEYLDNIVKPKIFNCSELCLYITSNNIILKNGDDGLYIE